MDSELKNTTNSSLPDSQSNSLSQNIAVDFSAYLVKKTERLVSAVYLVTGLIPENDPIRHLVRQESAGLMSFIVEYKNISLPVFDNFLMEVEQRIQRINSYLQVCQNSGLVSKMNSELITKEFNKILDEVLNNKSKLESENRNIPSSFFDVPLSYKNTSIEGYIQGVKSDSNHTQKDTKIFTDKPVDHEVKRSGRQSVILNLIKKKKEVTIKDISEVVKNCSEKTIQRELTAFISSGVLKRVGERRWSKYSLI